MCFFIIKIICLICIIRLFFILSCVTYLLHVSMSLSTRKLKSLVATQRDLILDGFSLVTKKVTSRKQVALTKT